MAGFVVNNTKPDNNPDKIDVTSIVQRYLNTTSDILPYKPAVVYNGPTEQFVHFSYWSKLKKKYIRQKVRLTVSARLTKEKRLKGLQFLCDELNQVIKSRNKNGLYHEDFINADGASLSRPFVEWVELLKDDKQIDIPESTRLLLGSFYYSYNQFLESSSVFSLNSAYNINDTVIQEYVRFLKSEGKTGKTINSYLWAMNVVSGILVKKKVIESEINTEPFRVKQIKNETGKFRPLTSEEKNLMFDYFREKDKPYFLYLLSIYYTCIRPKELNRLTIANIDLVSKKIFVPWYLSKNGLSNYVQILSALSDALNEYDIYKYPQSYFIFGYDNLKPGTQKFDNKRASDKWRAARQKLGIHSSAKMYGLKHTFNVDYVENNKHNINWEWLRRHNRHADIRQTQEYISGLTAYFLDETKAVIKNYHLPENAKHS